MKPQRSVWFSTFGQTFKVKINEENYMATYLLIDALEFSIDVLARRGNQTDGFFPYAKNLYTNFKVSMAESLFFPRFDLVFPVFFPGLGIL